MYSSSTFIKINDNDKSIKIFNNQGKLTHILIHYLCTLTVVNSFLIVEQSQESKKIRLQFASNNEAKIAHNKLRDALIIIKNNNNIEKEILYFDSFNDFPAVGLVNTIYIDNSTLLEYVYLNNEYKQLNASGGSNIIEMVPDPILTTDDIGKIIMNDNNLATPAIVDYNDKQYVMSLANGTFFKFPTFTVFGLSIITNPLDGNTISISYNGDPIIEYTFISSGTPNDNQILIGTTIYVTMINIYNKLLSNPDNDVKFLITGQDYTTGNLLTTIYLSFAIPGSINNAITFNSTNNSFNFNAISHGSLNDNDKIYDNLVTFYKGDDLDNPFISFTHFDLILFNSTQTYRGDFVIYYDEINDSYHQLYVVKNTKDFLYVLGEYIKSFDILNYRIEQHLNQYQLILKDNLEYLDQYTELNYMEDGIYPYEWDNQTFLNQIFFKKPIGVLKDLIDNKALVDTSLIVNVRLAPGHDVILSEPNNNDNILLRIGDGGYVEVYERDNTNLQPNFPYLIPLTNGIGGELITAKWQDDYVPEKQEDNINYNFHILYVSDEYGDDWNAVNGDPTRPFKTINAAINSITIVDDDEYIIEVLPGIYTENNIYMKHNVTLNFSSGCVIYGTFYFVDDNNTTKTKIRVNGNAIHKGAKVFQFRGYYDAIINLEYCEYAGRVDLYGEANSLNVGTFPNLKSSFIFNANYIKQTGYVQQYFGITHRGNMYVEYNLPGKSHIEAGFDLRDNGGVSNIDFALNFNSLTMGDVEPHFLQSKNLIYPTSTNTDGKITLNGKELNYLYNKYSNLIGVFIIVASSKYKYSINIDKIYTKNILVNNYSGGLPSNIIFNNCKIISDNTPNYLIGCHNNLVHLYFNNCEFFIKNSNNTSFPTFKLFDVDNNAVNMSPENSPVLCLDKCKFYFDDKGSLFMNFVNRPTIKYNTNIYIYDTYIYHKDGSNYSYLIEANSNTLPIEIMNYNLKSNMDEVHPIVTLREPIDNNNIVLPDKIKFL